MTELKKTKSKLGEERGRNDNVEKIVETRINRKTEALIKELRTNLAEFEEKLKAKTVFNFCFILIFFCRTN